jgi:hypothetical protein
MMRPARASASSGWRTPSWIMANSSPPRRHGVNFEHAGLQPVGRRDQKSITHGMAESVVNLLEIVQVETNHRELGSPAGHDDSLFHALPEQHSIGQFGERVMASHERDTRFGLLPLRDVLVRRNPTATGHRLMVNGDNPAIP